jgi:hypothetical protein
MGVEQPSLFGRHHPQVIQNLRRRPLDERLAEQPLRLGQVLFGQRFFGIFDQLRRDFLVLQAALVNLRSLGLLGLASTDGYALASPSSSIGSAPPATTPHDYCPPSQLPTSR